MNNHYVTIVFLFCIFTQTSCIDVKEKQISPNSQPHIYHLKELNSNFILSLDKEKTVVLIPGGILEQHGPYLPSYSDGYWNERFTESLSHDIANKGWNVVVFPVIPLGNSGANDVGHKYSFPGTYTVRFETLRSIFMDLAIELGEQGFKNIFIIHAHGAPNHQRALDQASDFFNDVYTGRMVNLFGLSPIMSQWFQAAKTEEEDKQNGMCIHSGLEETSSMLFIVPHLVDNTYKNAPNYTGHDMDSLIQLAKKDDWKGYFGAPKLATASFGEKAWIANKNFYSEYVLGILSKKINPDTVQRFEDEMKNSDPDVLLDKLSLLEENKRKQKQEQWLQKNGY